MNIKKLSKYLGNIIIIFFFSFILLEASLRIYSKYNNITSINENLRNYIHPFFEEGEVFKTFENFFTFKENIKDKRFINYFYNKKSNEIIKIWDYKFSTNNYGLVQKNNIDEKKDSILFLGDSFTVGWGAEPWINNFDGEINNLQIINGGQPGAGFWQFHQLEKYFSNILNIKKLVVVFISQDINRGKIISKNSKCIKSYLDCDPNKDRLITFPKSKEFDIDKYAKKTIQENKFLKNSSKKSQIKFFIRNLHTYTYFGNAINTIRKKNNLTIKRNLSSIIKLNDKYQKDIIFIQIKSPIDIGLKFETYETKVINKFFIENNLKRFQCNFNNNLSFFHKFDYHPNENGYNEIFNCVKNILANNLN